MFLFRLILPPTDFSSFHFFCQTNDYRSLFGSVCAVIKKTEFELEKERKNRM